MRRLYWSAVDKAAHTRVEACEAQVDGTQRTLDRVAGPATFHWENENETFDKST